MEDKVDKEDKKAKRLEQLAQARQKALEKRRLIGEVSRLEKAAKEEAFQDKLKTLKMLKGPTPKEDVLVDVVKEEPPMKPVKKKAVKKKVTKKVIEISDSSSSSSDDSSSSEEECSSEDEPKVQYIVKRKKKASKSKATHKKVDKVADVETSRLTAEVAKDLLKKRVMDDAHKAAFASLFPLHQFH
jgi:hypothetical protein